MEKANLINTVAESYSAGQSRSELLSTVPAPKAENLVAEQRAHGDSTGGGESPPPPARTHRLSVHRHY